MANNFKIKDKFDYFDKKTNMYFEIYYEIREPKIYFYYKNGSVTSRGDKSGDDASFTFAEEGKLLLTMEFEIDGAGNRRIVNREYEADLDIGIKERYGHVVVTVKTIRHGSFDDLYWYQSGESPPAIDAIMTEHDRAAHYGELEYSTNGQSWNPKIPNETCRWIRFKAKAKSPPPYDEKHKFSYNVRMPDFHPFLEIDPDIQNPKS